MTVAILLLDANLAALAQFDKGRKDVALQRGQTITPGSRIESGVSQQGM